MLKNLKPLSLKSLSKTRWRIEPDRITVYPYGLSYILAAVLSIFFLSGYLVYLYYLRNSFTSSLPILLILITVVTLFILWAGISVEFDISAGVMRKKLMGLLTISSLPFSKIYGISPVSNMAGSYTYKLFKKNDRYGKGILVSSSYGKNDDPNAIAFVDQVITPLHRHLEAHDSPGDFAPQYIDEYKFFIPNGGAYILKRNRIGSLLLGVCLLAIGIHELTPYAWLGGGFNIGRVCFLLFTLVGGPAIILSGFTEITFDKGSRLLTRKNPIGLGNRTYSFDDFNGIQTVRKSTNMIYSGTDVQVYFLRPDRQKEDVLVLSSFFGTKKVERFVAEVNSILIKQTK
ncbi:hypothetical protein OQZ33_18330 [Pedobacter sp. MC2016-05]|uniref:hypothetical protein n=1 Tax=Pedobacter sp. MC2016-05 TaxID=2994474 RepID=UPI0022454668|nr:hypothetical protein [Pedobacter sp. MC2016-05]MCX2476298.1 hypothetical protein [Pedobacter sp. MC2016-05]